MAIIAEGRQAIVVIYKEGEEINYFILYFIDSDKPFNGGLVQPLAKRLPGVGYVPPSKPHGAGGGNGSIVVGMFVCLCLASQNPFEREFFVPARTKSTVNYKHNNHKHHHHGGAVCPSYGVGSMDTPGRMSRPSS